MALVDILLFLLGLVLLLKGSDLFVKSAASIAKKLGVSEFVIGLTLVAIGTSLPELSSAIAASFKKESGLIIGNIVGANISDLSLVAGLAATFAVIKTKKEMLKRDGYIMLFVILLFYIFILDKLISRLEALFFLLLNFVYLLFLYEADKNLRKEYNFKEFLKYFFKFRYLITIKSSLISGVRVKNGNLKLTDIRGIMNLFIESLIKDFFVLVVSGLAIVFGAKYFVNGAIFLADALNVNGTLIGVSIVSIGTTLPELGVTFSAARKGYGEIAIGNVIGSCITNILLILGIAAFINPLAVIDFTLSYSAPFLIFISIIFLIFLGRKWEITHAKGMALLMLYLIFLSFVLSQFIFK